MDREEGNIEKVRKCREWTSLHFVILSPFPLHFLILSPLSCSPAARLPQVVDLVCDKKKSSEIPPLPVPHPCVLFLFCPWALYTILQLFLFLAFHFDFLLCLIKNLQNMTFGIGMLGLFIVSGVLLSSPRGVWEIFVRIRVFFQQPMNWAKTLVSSHGNMKIAPNWQFLKKKDFKILGRPPILPTHCLGHCFRGRDFP